MKAKFGVSMTSANPPSTSRKLFLTGASGVVGQALLKRLPGDRVVCLAHRQPVSAPGVETVQGDVRERRFGSGRGSLPRPCRWGRLRRALRGQHQVLPARRRYLRHQRGRHRKRSGVGPRPPAPPFYFVSTAFVRPLRSLAGPARLERLRRVQAPRRGGCPHKRASGDDRAPFRNRRRFGDRPNR